MTDRFDAKIALEELQEDALLPHPVRLRDMILRNVLAAQDARDINREFQEYLTAYGQSQKLAREILLKLASGTPKETTL
jgi:hypothetical protein